MQKQIITLQSKAFFYQDAIEPYRGRVSAKPRFRSEQRLPLNMRSVLTPSNHFQALPLNDLPEHRSRSLILELRRQNPRILEQKGQSFYVKDLFKFSQSRLGRAYWENFINYHPKITF